MAMRNSVEQRGKTWRFIYDGPSVNGKRHQITKGGFKTKHEAKAALAEIKHRLNSGGYVEPSSLSLGAFLDRWLDSISGECPANVPGKATGYLLSVT